MNAKPDRKLCSVSQLPSKYPDAGFTQSSVRWWIFNREENGFTHCILKIGSRVYIDLDRFNEWLDQKAMEGGNL